MGGSSFARTGLCLWLLAAGVDAAATAPGAADVNLAIYVDAPVGTATNVLDLDAVATHAMSSGTCTYRRLGGAFEVTPQGELACYLEVRTDRAVVHIHVHGVPPFKHERGVVAPYQSFWPETRFGRSGNLSAHTVTNDSDAPVVLEGVGDTAALAALGGELHRLPAAYSAEELVRWWEVAEPFEPTTLAPGESVTMLIATPSHVRGVTPYAILSDPASGERWSRPLTGRMPAGPLAD